MRLKVPRHSTRPTADRVKEAMFNRLGQWLDDEVVLDLFAGSGNLGLEALSRGAREVLFVEQNRQVLSVLRENLETLGFGSQASILPIPVSRAISKLQGKLQFSLVFVDPPYEPHILSSVLEQLDQAQLLLPGGRLVAEHEKREHLPEHIGGLRRISEARFGDTLLSFYEKAKESD